MSIKTPDYGKCPNCGCDKVEHIDSNPDSDKSTITEICLKCKRTTIWNKRLVL